MWVSTFSISFCMDLTSSPSLYIPIIASPGQYLWCTCRGHTGNGWCPRREERWKANSHKHCGIHPITTPGNVQKTIGCGYSIDGEHHAGLIVGLDHLKSLFQPQEFQNFMNNLIFPGGLNMEKIQELPPGEKRDWALSAAMRSDTGVGWKMPACCFL